MATEKARQLLLQLVADDRAFVSTLCILQSELSAMISLDPLRKGKTNSLAIWDMWLQSYFYDELVQQLLWGIS